MPPKLFQWDVENVFHRDVIAAFYNTHTRFVAEDAKPGSEAWKDYEAHRDYLREQLIGEWVRLTGLPQELWPVPDNLMGATWTKIRKFTASKKRELGIGV